MINQILCDRSIKKYVLLAILVSILVSCTALTKVENTGLYPVHYQDKIGFTNQIKTGFINQTGELVTFPKFDEVIRLSENSFLVKTDHTWSLLDQTGKIAIQPQFQNLELFAVQAAAKGSPAKILGIRSGVKEGLIDKTGKIIVQPQFDCISDFKDGLATIKQGFIDRKYGFIDETGKIIVQPQFDYISDFKDGLAKVGNDEKYGLIDKTGSN
jgi:hypothetical protein